MRVPNTEFRRTAIAVGALFWVSNLATLVGGAVTGFIPTADNALRNLYPHATQVVVGTLISHTNEAALIGYAVLLYPVLARYSPGLALGYAAFKVVEGVMLLVGAAALLSLLPVSQSYLASAGSDAGSYKPVAEQALAQAFWAGRLGTLAYLVATPILNVVLFQTRLVPRFLSVWGLGALGLLAIGLAAGVGDPTRGFEPAQLLVIPIILWELTFATWLIVRGFNTSAVRGTDRVARLEASAAEV
jgi:Domain of unknown function (DUF4386)